MSGWSVTPARCVISRKSSDWVNLRAFSKSSHSMRITVSLGASALRNRRAPLEPLSLRMLPCSSKPASNFHSPQRYGGRTCRASVASSFLPLSPAAWLWRSLHHIAHATPRHWRYLLLRLRDDYISDDDETGDGGRILERASRNHRRVDDACRNQILILAGESVEADRITLSSDPVYHNRGVGPSVLSDLADRLLKCSVDDPGAAALVAIEGAEEVAHGLLSMQQRNPTARHDALFEGCPRRTQSIFDTVLLLLELCLGCGTHLDNGNTAS